MCCTLDEHMKIQDALHHLADHHLCVRDWTEICKGVSQRKTLCDFNGVEYSILSVLFYIMDSFLPIIRRFLSQCWDERTLDFEADEVKQIFSELKQLSEGVEVSTCKSENCYKEYGT